MRTIVVDLNERSYPILIGKGLLKQAGALLAEAAFPKRTTLITDKNVAALHLKTLNSSLKRAGFEAHVIVMPAGEPQKSLKRAEAIYGELLSNGRTRDSSIIAFGGGVVGDVSGFVAATFRRGVPYVQIPTTLLGQMESSIGGKTGVNHALGKNAIGAFYQPRMVLSDLSLLASLPRRELFCGLGEILKYAFLSEDMFELISRNLDAILAFNVSAMEEVVCRCVELKAAMIEVDERETLPVGGRMVLNVGHTVGHALESLSAYRLHHGEAVLIALRVELAAALDSGILIERDFRRLDELIAKAKFSPNISYISHAKIVNYLYKKGAPKFVLPRRIGEIVSTKEISATLLAGALKTTLRGG
jgi:3-dehydroquinate synthase